MEIATFFGHHDCSSTLEEPLYRAVEDLICQHSVDTFYLGNQGDFDRLALYILRKLKKKYPHITYTVILAMNK